MYEVLTRTGGVQEYKHETGEISMVKIELAGMGIRKVRIANLPPETSDGVIDQALRQYGDMKEIYEERWGRQYCFAGLSNGIRIVEQFKAPCAIAHGHSRTPGFSVIRRAAIYVLRL
jgi:hypothetical protein